MDRKAAACRRGDAVEPAVGPYHGAICRSRFLRSRDRARPRHRRDHQCAYRPRHRSEAPRPGRIQSRFLRVVARSLSARESRAGRRLSAARYAAKCPEHAWERGGLRPAAGHQADADAAETHSRCLRGAGAPRALRSIHLFGGAADSEIAARRVHRSFRADLDESSARPCLGVSQGLTRPAHSPGGLAPNAFSDMAALKILVIPGSLRTGSHNPKLAAAAAYEFAQADAEVTRLSLGDFPLPIYDGDLQTKSGVPKNAVNLKRMIAAHHGVLLVTPEYNSSVPPLLKNAIDWVTRVQDPHETRGQVFRERPFAIASASQSRLGGTRALAALRLILGACQAMVVPNQLALSFADQAYDEMDKLKVPADIEALKALVRQLIDVSQHMM